MVDSLNMANVKRPLFTYFLPGSFASRVRRISYAAPTILFAGSVLAILSKQSYFRSTLAEESVETTDRIERRSYVALPDGRMALVYPVVYPDVTPTKLWEALKETVSLLP
jgi:hypothetical protein